MAGMCSIVRRELHAFTTAGTGDEHGFPVLEPVESLEGVDTA